MKRKYFLFLFCGLFPIWLQAQNFIEYFHDKTLRVDYIFSGDSHQQTIVLDGISKFPGWAGRLYRLSELPVEGSGQIEMRSKRTDELIYNHSFSTLFQEWLLTDEAETLSRGFENSFLLPFPKDTVEITIRLLDNRKEVMTSFTHRVVPDDILIREKGQYDLPAFQYLVKNGEPSEKIDIVILPEGYTKEEMDIFNRDAQIACENLFSHAPFDRLKEYFNVLAVEIPSEHSGVSIPGKREWKNTAFGSHFDTFYSERYLTTTRIKDIHDRITGIPYEHIIILANTDHYGGGGIYNGFTLTTAHHRNFNVVVVHEFGHSFAGLADEYFYDGDAFSDMYPFDIEPWEQNITTLVDFASKWEDMIPDTLSVPTSSEDKSANEIGVYEGAGYSSKGIYRPAPDCRMRTNGATAFCEVCQRAIERMIRFYVDSK